MRKVMKKVIILNLDLEYGDPFFVKKPIAVNQSDRKGETFPLNPFTEQFLTNSAKVLYNERVYKLLI